MLIRMLLISTSGAHVAGTAKVDGSSLSLTEVGRPEWRDFLPILSGIKSLELR